MSSSSPSKKFPSKSNLASISEGEPVESKSLDGGQKPMDSNQQNGGDNPDHDSISNYKKAPSWLEASFVHLSAPPELSAPSSDLQYHSKHGFQEEHLHLLELLEASVQF